MLHHVRFRSSTFAGQRRWVILFIFDALLRIAPSVRTLYIFRLRFDVEVMYLLLRYFEISLKVFSMSIDGSKHNFSSIKVIYIYARQNSLVFNVVSSKVDWNIWWLHQTNISLNEPCYKACFKRSEMFRIFYWLLISCYHISQAKKTYQIYVKHSLKIVQYVSW